MSDVTPSIQSFERLLAHAIAALAPFFIDGAKGDMAVARGAVASLLDDYKPVTPRELQLAAQLVALSFASLACLGAASATRSESIDAMLDFQDAAIALNALSEKSSKALAASQKERVKNPRALTPEKTRWDEGAFQRILNKALEKHDEANAKVADYIATFAPVVKKTKLPILSAEPMTPSVLTRRARLH